MAIQAQLARHKSIAMLMVKYRDAGIFSAPGLDPTLISDDEAKAIEPGRPDELVADLEALGPTFIKLGQSLATRPDLVGKPWRKALERLQDDVGRIPFDQVRDRVEEELGARLSSAFQSFDEKPLAAASLAQVHGATLRDGRAVVVKVQRPGVRETIQQDLAALETLAGTADHLTEAGRRYQFRDWVAEFRQTLMAELDFLKEAENLEMAASNLSSYPMLQVPQPVWDLSSHRVLTMDRIRGQRVDRIPDVVRTEKTLAPLATALVKAYLDQAF
ncbi:MAG: AarF/UbiB family protein, partial [Xanthomonadales bacterium]|nr:AarF/UbiB family protein [Xanthomonadales bacterium]